jgi:chorismate mutase
MASKAKGKPRKDSASEEPMLKRLDAILGALQSLLIIEGHDAGMTKAKARAIAGVADGRASSIWRQLVAARKAKEKKEAKASQGPRGGGT